MRTSIAKTNRFRYAKKRAYPGSSCHVRRRVEVDQEADAGDDQHHHAAERVDAELDVDRDVAPPWPPVVCIQSHAVHVELARARSSPRRRARARASEGRDATPRSCTPIGRRAPSARTAGLPRRWPQMPFTNAPSSGSAEDDRDEREVVAGKSENHAPRGCPSLSSSRGRLRRSGRCGSMRKSDSTIARPTATSAASAAMMKNAKTGRSWLSAAQRAVEGDEREVHRVEHDLDAHQRDEHVAPHEEADAADGEEDGAEDDVVLGGDHVAPGFPSARCDVDRARSPFADPGCRRGRSCASSPCLAARDGDGADDGDHEERARQLERHEAVGEERATERVDARRTRRRSSCSGEPVRPGRTTSQRRLEAARPKSPPPSTRPTRPRRSRGGVALGPSSMMTKRKRTTIAPA